MAPPATATLLDGRALAERIRLDHVAEVKALSSAGRALRLVAVKVGRDEAAESYLRGQRRGAEAWGIDYAVEELPASADERAVRRAIRRLDEDPAVSGVLLSLPLPPGLGARSLQHEIDPTKDVEGVHPENLGGCFYGRYALLPCTALAVMALVEASGIALEGRECVVVGHSEIVGKPVALLLLSRNATVTVCHKFTTDVAAHTRRADLLVVAVGKQPNLIRADMVKPGAVVIDVGTNPVADPKAAGGWRMVGDVDFPAVSKVASAITPVPGGVGPVTVAMLLRNTVLAARGVPPVDDPGQLPLFTR